MRERSTGTPACVTSCLPLSSRDLSRDLFSAYLYGHTTRPGWSEEPSDPLRRLRGPPRGLAHRLRDPVDHDRKQQDADPRDQARAEVVRKPVYHLIAEAFAANEPGDDDDGQHHHDGLVDPEHDRWLRQRELHLAQQLILGCTERDGGFDAIMRHLPD